jgi:hypothetical protein
MQVVFYFLKTIPGSNDQHMGRDKERKEAVIECVSAQALLWPAEVLSQVGPLGGFVSPASLFGPPEGGRKLGYLLTQSVHKELRAF